MIIKNNFDPTKNNLEKKRQATSELMERKRILKQSIDKLNTRYQKGAIDNNKFTKIADKYAIEQKNINFRMKNLDK